MQGQGKDNNSFTSVTRITGSARCEYSKIYMNGMSIYMCWGIVIFCCNILINWLCSETTWLKRHTSWFSKMITQCKCLEHCNYLEMLDNIFTPIKSPSEVEKYHRMISTLSEKNPSPETKNIVRSNRHLFLEWEYYILLVIMYACWHPKHNGRAGDLHGGICMQVLVPPLWTIVRSWYRPRPVL